MPAQGSAQRSTQVSIPAIPAGGQGPFSTSLPRQTPGLVAGQAPAVSSAWASAPAPEELSADELIARESPTLTQQLRAMQPPDVARQAIEELHLLADELIALASELETSGLARTYGRAYLDLAQRYGELARQAWLSVAAERLEQDGASAEYRHQVVGIAREVTRLRRESAVAASNEVFPLPRRRPPQWRRRVRVICQALASWQSALNSPAEPRRMGVALFHLRGALNTAAVPWLDYTTLGALTIAARWLTPIAALAGVLGVIAATLAHNPLRGISDALVTLLALMLWTTLSLLTARGSVTLLEALAGACFSVSRSACNGKAGSQFISGALRLWWLLIGAIGSLATLATLAGSVAAFVQLGVAARLGYALSAAPTTRADRLNLGAGALALLAAPAAAVAIAGLVALALPAFAVTTLRFASEFAGSRRWGPAARRYAFAPALNSLAYLTGALVILAWLVADRLHLESTALLTLITTGGHWTASARALVLALALALPYLAFIEAPFRSGVGRWRRTWLRDLRSRKATIEAHVRRLSASDPHTGGQDTSEETLRAMQYDLALIQFYTMRIEEAERISAAPFGWGGAVTLLLFFLIAALLLDVGGQSVAHALILRLTP